jgi:hypothetical protein
MANTRRKVVDQAVREATDRGELVFLGNSAGVVDVPGEPGRVYVTDTGNHIMKAWNAGVPSIPRHSAYLKKINGKLIVTELRNSYQTFVYPEVASHGFLHEWGPMGTDVVRVWGPAWMPWKVEPGTVAFHVTVYRAVYLSDTGWLADGAEDVDLSGSVPATANEGLYVLLSVAEDGTITITEGTPQADYTNLTLADIPALPTGDKALYAIRLYEGQTGLSYNYTTNDFIDLRHLQAGGGGTGSYSLPIASDTQLGGVKIDGNGLSIDGSGVLSVTVGGSGHTIENDSTPLTARANLDFTGTGVDAIDHAGTDTTEVNILPVFVGDSPPDNPEDGRLWLDTDDPEPDTPDLIDFSSGEADSGDVPTADGAGGITWEAPTAPPSDASAITFTPTTAGDWTGSADPGNADDALDQLADRTKTLETATPTVSSVTIPASPVSDHTAAGALTTLTAAATMHFGDVGYIASTGKVAILNETSVATSFGVVMCIDATINADASGNFLLLGIARDDTWNWTVGGPIYGSTTGTTGNTLTQTAPSGAGNVIQILGIALSADTMLFTPQLTQVEHA